MQDNQLRKEEISQLTEADWKERLTADEYHIMREKGTERPFTGVYNDATDDGVYRCKGCGASLFDSSNKFDSVKSVAPLDIFKKTPFGILSLLELLLLIVTAPIDAISI